MSKRRVVISRFDLEFDNRRFINSCCITNLQLSFNQFDTLLNQAFRDRAGYFAAGVTYL